MNLTETQRNSVIVEETGREAKRASRRETARERKSVKTQMIKTNKREGGRWRQIETVQERG